jgi:hypothetical protein
MTSDDRKRARAVCDAATKGPWKFQPKGTIKSDAYGAAIAFLSLDADGIVSRADGEFIAFARTALPWALDEIERLRSALERIADPFTRTGTMVDIARAALGKP